MIRNVRALARPTLDVHTMHFSRRLPAALLPWDVSQANQCDAYRNLPGRLAGNYLVRVKVGWKGAKLWIRSLILFFDEFHTNFTVGLFRYVNQ